MVRTQVYIPDEQYSELRIMVAMGYGNISELIREGVDNVIQSKKRIKKGSKFDPLKDMAGMLKGGPKDLSKKIDYYLYDEPYQNK